MYLINLFSFSNRSSNNYLYNLKLRGIEMKETDSRTSTVYKRTVPEPDIVSKFQ